MFTRSLTLLFFLTCTIHAVAAVSVSVSPSTAAVAVSGTLQFAPTVSGTTTTTVTWSVDGIAGGNATVGTITAGGLYTAPTAAGTHSIKATSTADSTQSATAQTTVFDSVSVDFGSRTNTSQPIPANWFGAQLSTFQDWASVGMVAQAGVTGTRLYANIDTVYATQTPDWTKIDPIIQHLKDAGIRPILQIAYTPSWLQPSPNPCQGLTNLYKAPPTDVNAWANMAASYVSHMNATFPGFITDYEIWNEPDNQALLCVADNTDATRRTTYFNIYAAAGPAMRAAAGSTLIRIGGPALSTPDQHWSTWIQPFVTNSSLAPYIDFVSYHHYFGYKNNLTFDSGADTLYSRTQGSYRGVISIYNRIANIVKAGSQPNAASTPIYVDEYNTTSDPTVDCCRSSSTYSPVWNALLVADLLNTSYQGAPHLPAWINYYSVSNPSSQACLFGVINANMDCAYPTSGTPSPYPQHYAYKLLMTPNYLGLGSGGYAAASVSPPATQRGIVVAGFYSANRNGVLLVNPTSTDYSALTVNFDNPGYASVGATGYLLNSTNQNITTQALSVSSTASGFAASVSLPPYSVLAISLVQQSGPPPVGVSISPTTASVATGATQQFQATVTGATDTSVVWSVDGVNGGNTTVGTVSTSGLYTAPTTTGNHTVTATSNADSTKSASAAVTVTGSTSAVSVSISPTTASVATGATQQFQATVTGATDTSVVWSVDGVNGGNTTVGTVSTSGLYTAPSTTGNHTVTATSNADSTKSASAAVTVTGSTSGVSVSISPTTASVATGATQQFQATVTGATDTSVSWSVDGVNGGNTTVGTVSTSGLYTAPTTAGNHTVTATANADSTKSASSQVTVTAIRIAISPTAVTLPLNGTKQFAAIVTGTNNKGVKWFVDGVRGGTTASGVITNAGKYTAPNAAGNHTVTITSNADPTQSASAAVTVSNSTAVSISISPQSASLATGATEQFQATVTGTTNTAVTWSVDGATGGNTTVGTVSTTGLYTAPTTTGNHTVTATSNADTTKSASAAVTVTSSTQTVAVSISPTTASVATNATQQFQATVTGTTNTSVAWSVDGVTGGNTTVGTVSTSGLYTAPSSTGTHTVTATSNADSTKSASAAVTVTGGTQTVAVSISPTTASVATGATQQFQATVTGTTNTAVTWSVDGVNSGNTTIGTVSATGLYTAPTTTGSHTVTATSNADTTKSASAAVTVTGSTQTVAVSISPTSASVATSATQQFQATVTGATDTSVAWSVDGVTGGNTTVGTVSAAGLYTAPGTTGNHTVTATSNADSTKSASAAVTVTSASGVTIAISPTSVLVPVGTNKQFAATVTGTTNTGVKWYVDDVLGGTTSSGTITTAGLYTAPSATGNHVVKITSNADPTKFATSQVTVTTITIAISPTAVTIPLSGTKQFAATVTGTTNTGVKWYVDGVLGGNTTSGLITTAGNYTAPNSAGSHTVTITSNADPTKSASSAVTVSNSTAVSISVSPQSASIAGGATQQFQATVTGTTNTAVTWSVDGVSGGNTTVGTVSSTGLYTAPSASGNHTVTATSNADTTKSASAAVTVTGSTQTVAVSISPTTASVATGATQQFQATVTGATDTSVVWSVDGVNGGNTTVGTVSTSGLYTAPTTTGNHTVKATSNADTTKSASAAVTVTATQTVAVSISPTTASVATGATQQFQATVTGATDTSVTWSVDGVNGGNTTVGTVSTSGLYTAPTTTGNHTVTATSNADSTKSASAAVTVTASTDVTVKVTPSIVGVTYTQPQQFVATLTNTTNTAVTWSIDGVAGGNSTVGTIDSTGLYTPPQTAGPHNVVATSVADTTKSGTAQVIVTNHPGVFTYYMDNNRTGANTKEIILTPSNVNAAQFGQLFAYNVDGNVFAEPLYVPNLQIPGVGPRNVVFIATEHDSVYAFDADNRQAAPYWQTSFIDSAAGITTIPATDLPRVLVGTEIGITSTPAIDPVTNTIYVIAATKENGSYFHRLHALDITTGAEKLGGPTTIQASVPGTGDGSVNGTVTFDPLMHLQRGAVTLSNGVIYATWASHADTSPYHGWIMAFDATHLNLLAVFNSTPNSGLGGIWQAGCGPAADSSGNVYFVTGNATFNANTGGTEYGDTVIRAHVTSAGFAIDDYFTPTNQSTLDTSDLDLGSTCTLLVPVTQSGTHPNIMMAGGKQNRVYVLDRDNLGRFNSTSDANAIQVFSVATSTSTSKLFSHAAYWNGNVYFQPNGDALKAYTLSNGLVSSSPTSVASFTIGFPGASPVVTANGTSNGLVWLYQRGNGVLHAFDAANVANKLFSSPTSGTQVKFAIPTVVNGKVYVGTNNQLVVFGLLGK